MHPRITELLDFVDEQTALLRDAYHAVPPERRGVRPAADRWSAAECVRHLTIVDGRIDQVLTTLIAQAQALPPEADDSPVLPSLNIDRVFDRTKRFTTGRASEPHDADPARAWADYLATRERVVATIRTGDGLALSQVAAPHPAFGPISAYAWIAFVGAHAARHAAQIREDYP